MAQVQGHVAVLGPGRHDVSSTQATGFYGTDQCVVLGECAGHPQWLQGLLGLQWHSQVQCLGLGKVVVVVGASGMHTLVYQLQNR